MTLSIIYYICLFIIGFLIGTFAVSVISKLRKINSQIDSILKPKHCWNMGVYMEDIPHNEQNTKYFDSAPLKIIYERSEYSDLVIPRVGEEVSGIYYSGTNKFAMKGTVTRVFYNTDIDWIVVHCKCTNICKVKDE